MTLGNRIAHYRKSMNITQDALARQLEVTNQAVSKWESDQCCPDVMLLPRLADIFGITIDELFGRAAETERRQPMTQCRVEDLPWEDDNILRAVGYVGKRLVGFYAAKPGLVIQWNEDVDCVLTKMSVSCGNVSGDVDAGGSVTCGEVGGDVDAGTNVTCGNVGGDVDAGAEVNCGDVGGDVDAGAEVNCGNVEGSVDAGSNVTCGNVGGSVDAGDTVSCADIEGDVDAGGSVTCSTVHGDIDAGGKVIIKG